MSKGFENAFRNLQSKLQSFQKDSLTVIQVMSERHYRDSFRDGGFTNDSLQRWKPLKNRQANPLVKTGQLRGSVRSQIIGNSVHVLSDLPYAGYQNYGTKYIPQRQFIGLSKKLNRDIKNRIMGLAKKIFY